MYHFEFQDDIESRVASQTVRHLHRLWMRYREASGALPTYADLGPERLDWCAGSLMVLEPLADDDYRYRYYGAAIAHAARFDMTGKRVSEFRSDVGRFFREKYGQCLASGRPLYTVHRATHVPTVHTWERLMMPVREDGTELIVAFNQPMEFRHEFLQAVLESSLVGMLFAGAMRDPAGRVDSFQILSANSAAARLLNVPRESLEERTLEEVLPAHLKGRLTALCHRIHESGASEKIEANGLYNGVERVVQANGVKSGDGVTLVMMDVSRLRAQETVLDELEGELSTERELRSRLELQIRGWPGVDGLVPVRREVLLSILEELVDRNGAAAPTASLVLVRIVAPGGKSGRIDALDRDEVVRSVQQLLRGMAGSHDAVERISTSTFATPVIGVPMEEAVMMARRMVEAVALRFRTEPMLSSRLNAAAVVAAVDASDAAGALDRGEAALGDLSGGEVRLLDG